ncbi:phosphatidylglycerol lysyltransferase domain-containing protein [Dyadobacter sp. LHD-138]|uniref:phosphatidylglycerol lysyltransferase domain-containing protein n=1 Tax=Dyadobacter sp. LHD-138 TaxID=3071413 RepID=UPI0027DF9907|nr:phosphatidylglycerol lysyltransferase domain-containing protein [Dyadobacter sp. LHD-138]MDQ6480203.1 phosphatidylglycerol lysyltransferase domain-containing protein [Dyadobacter sp. LHD-138]
MQKESSLFRSSFNFLTENKRIIVRGLIGAVCMLMAVWFVRHEEAEVRKVYDLVQTATPVYIALGLLVTVLYIFLQGLTYQLSFKALEKKIDLLTLTELFLRRNFISVFLPAGGISSLAFFTSRTERKGVTKTEIHLASSIYAVCGIVSVFVVAVPAIVWLLFQKTVSDSEVYAFCGLFVLIILLFLGVKSFVQRGRFFKFLLKYQPDLDVVMEQVSDGRFSRSSIGYCLLASVLIDLAGIVHLYIAFFALHVTAPFEAAFMGYLIATIFLILSPFLRGIGAIELSLSVLLVQYGMDNVVAISVTMLYRFFEFWAPLLVGIFSFLFRKNNLILRILPAFLIFALGIVDIVSVLTPSINSRVHTLQDILPLSFIEASNYFVLLTGIVLIFMSVFLLKGYRTAYYLSLFLSVLSLVGHLTKGIDYEESLIAGFVMAVLVFTRQQYFRRGNKRFQLFGLRTVLVAICAVLVYGIVGFYYLDTAHFGIDFSLDASVQNTILSFLLIGNNLDPKTIFGRDFLYSLNLLGGGSLSFLAYTFIRPYIFQPKVEDESWQKAGDLVQLYGDSSLDYFKTYHDKFLYFGRETEGFIAYRVGAGFAVVLEKPVCRGAQDMVLLIKEFDQFCRENDLECAYYRCDELSLPIFQSLGKNSIIIGQEAVIDLKAFTLEGGDKKSLRNAVRNIANKGFVTKTYSSPVKEGVLQRLKAVSDEWIETTGYNEMVFSQGIFSEDELSKQTILTLENDEEKIIAFANIIPDYVRGEGTYDLIRKTKDAPGTTLDAMMVELINYFKAQDFQYLNIGMVPLSGAEAGKDITERTIKFAYQNVKQFGYYKSLREYKNKFSPEWRSKYLIYDDAYALIRIPAALNKVVKIKKGSL